jgi:hypothetical protein
VASGDHGAVGDHSVRMIQVDWARHLEPFIRQVGMRRFPASGRRECQYSKTVAMSARNGLLPRRAMCTIIAKNYVAVAAALGGRASENGSWGASV